MRGRLGTGTEGVVDQEHGCGILARGGRKGLCAYRRAPQIRPGDGAPGRIRAEKSSARLAKVPTGRESTSERNWASGAAHMVARRPSALLPPPTKPPLPAVFSSWDDVGTPDGCSTLAAGCRLPPRAAQGCSPCERPLTTSGQVVVQAKGGEAGGRVAAARTHISARPPLPRGSRIHNRRGRFVCTGF